MGRMKNLILVTATLLLAACAGPSQGIVVDKYHRDAFVTMEFVTHYRYESYTDTECTSSYNQTTKSYSQSCRPVSKSRSVPYSVYEPVHHPEENRLRLEHDCKPEGTKDKHGRVMSHRERCEYGWRSVDRADYNSAEIGTFWKAAD